MHRTRTAAATALATALAVLPLTGMAGPPGSGGKAGHDTPRHSPGMAASRSLSPRPGPSTTGPTGSPSPPP